MACVEPTPEAAHHHLEARFPCVSSPHERPVSGRACHCSQLTNVSSLRDQNQVLFYRIMQDHLEELLGILYTPGAAEAVANYSSLFRRPVSNQ